MPKFIRGLELSRLFYEEAVKPILDVHFAGLKYAAARIGTGSEVLGFDSQESTDHSWGPQLQIFLSEADLDDNRASIVDILANELPYEFHGYSTNYSKPDTIGVRLMEPTVAGPINHGVTVHTVSSFLRSLLGIDSHRSIDPRDWLTFSEQSLLSAVSGEVFVDDPGDLSEAREQFGYYPKDVWLYLLSAQWRLIEREEPLAGRCANAGDELGSRIIASHLVQHVMRLCFLQERRYAPYSKWFGTAFKQLNSAEKLLPILTAIEDAKNWKERERNLSKSYEHVANAHNDLGITEHIDPKVSPFHDRPYLVIHGDRFADSIRAQIRDEGVLRLTPDIGSIDQFSHSTDILSYPERRGRLKDIY